MKRRWILWLLVVGFVWLVVSRFTEIEKLLDALAQGRWEWVLLAALMQALYYVGFAALYQSAFHTVDVESRVVELLPVLFGSLFVKVVTPVGGGASGVALFVDDANRRGQSGARAAVGSVLVFVADFTTFTAVLVVGLVYLFLQHDLKAYEVVGSIALLLIIGALTGAMLMGLWQPDLLRRLLEWVQRTLDGLAARLKRPPLVPGDWAESSAGEFTDAAAAIAKHPKRSARTLAMAMSLHLLDIASLYVLFVAFGQPVRVGALVAGYAMGVLFWIIPTTPQGIGVVEGVMALVYTSLGVPAAKATVIAVSFRGLTFWLPVAVGFLMLRRVKWFGAGEQAVSQVWSIRLVALLTALMGLVNLFSAVTPTLFERMRLLAQFSPLEVRHGGHLTAALAGFALLVLARGLWRRKRAAWALTIVVLVLSIVGHMLKGLDYEEAILAAALALWLWSLRSHFHALSDAPSMRQGVGALAAASLFTMAYGVAGFYLLDRHFSVNFSLAAAIRQTVVMFTEFYDPGLEPLTGFGRRFADSIYAVGAATLGYALVMLLRPVLVRRAATEEERAIARRVVEAHGRSALARMTLFDDKSYCFSPGGSMVAYVVKRRVALALGDPVGPPGDVSAAIAAFRDLCSRNDWLPAFYQVPLDHLEQYRAAGFEALQVWQEGAVDLASFTLDGKSHRTMRNVINRLSKLGYRAEVHEPPIPDGLLEELRGVSDEWLEMMHGSEKRFSLGWFEDGYIRDAPVMAIHAPDGAVTAFANIVPEYHLDEITIDLMRHRRDVEQGTMDFLFISLFRWAKEQGYAAFSMGASPLAGVGEDSDDPAVERALHYIYEHFNQFYNFRGLHAFKEKFHPVWTPRYIIYPPGPLGLSAVSLAMVRATAGEGFVWDYARDFTRNLVKPHPR